MVAMLDRLEKAVRTVMDFPTPGIAFKDITPILADAELLRFAVDALVEPYRNSGITKVIGIEARGFILGGMMADSLHAGFVPVRKHGKLPFKSVSESYALEYGSDSIEMHVDAVDSSDLVLIHDDVIATGGTARAAHRLVDRLGAQVSGYAFLIELDFLDGRDQLESEIAIHSLLHF